MKLAALSCAILIAGCHDNTAMAQAKPPAAPQAVSPLPPPPRVFIGQHQLCIDDAGAFRCAGDNFSNVFPGLPDHGPDACPDGGKGCYAHLTSVPKLHGFDQLSFGFLYACASDPNSVTCWGNIEHFKGSAACATPVECMAFHTVKFPLADVAELVSTSDVTCARTRGGDVYCWGANDLGLVGDGTTDGVPCMTVTDPKGAKQIVKCRLEPTRVVGVAKATQIVMGMNHACALIADGSVQCWGGNDEHELGDGTPGEACTSMGRAEKCHATPVTAKIDNVSQLSAGRLHTCAVKRDGTVSCWGFVGIDAADTTPTEVSWLSDVEEVAAGFVLTCARTHKGEVSCWGLWPTEKGPWRKIVTPEYVLDGATSLAATEETFCAVTKHGPMCWGSNGLGQLGDEHAKQIFEPKQL
jgi:hypothetical protein